MTTLSFFIAIKFGCASDFGAKMMISFDFLSTVIGGLFHADRISIPPMMACVLLIDIQCIMKNPAECARFSVVSS